MDREHKKCEQTLQARSKSFSAAYTLVSADHAAESVLPRLQFALVTSGMILCEDVGSFQSSKTKAALGGLFLWVPMSALSPKADIGGVSSDVRFVPKADISSVWRARTPGRCTPASADEFPSVQTRQQPRVLPLSRRLAELEG